MVNIARPFVNGNVNSDVLQKSIMGATKNVTFRPLRPSDYDVVACLHTQWFPVRYNQQYFSDVTSVSDRYFTLAATDTNGCIVGLLVAELMPESRWHPEDSDILGLSFELGDRWAAYLMTLGVSTTYRRQGLGSQLLALFLSHLEGSSIHPDQPPISSDSASIKCQAIYLHVLSTNTPACRFYETHGFVAHRTHPHYYRLDGGRQDGLTYVKYINGGRPPYRYCNIS
eukprot:comp13989_c0_seq1/m.9809 comp13989_c0_seq1/g.9809  ORF comp13989_c0_seq1/g.9809 comp13989_c0_seq1/m.9809 type:complete len:227 (-) comp13989_c0_seq1:148-828(-)